MYVNSLPKTVTRERRGCDLNPGPSAPESSTLTSRLPSHPRRGMNLILNRRQRNCIYAFERGYEAPMWLMSVLSRGAARHSWCRYFHTSTRRRRRGKLSSRAASQHNSWEETAEELRLHRATTHLCLPLDGETERESWVNNESSSLCFFLFFGASRFISHWLAMLEETKARRLRRRPIVWHR